MKNQKLELKKETIMTLENADMNSIHGGYNTITGGTTYGGGTCYPCTNTIKTLPPMPKFTHTDPACKFKPQSTFLSCA